MAEAPDKIKNPAVVYRIKIIHSIATDLYIEKEGQKDGSGLKSGDLVVVPTRYGMELGRVLGIMSILEEIVRTYIQSMDRTALAADLDNY